MPRKTTNQEQEASLARVRSAIGNARFITELRGLLKAASIRNVEDIFESRTSEWDESRGWIIQYGLYFHLRDLCDDNGLFWQKDAAYITRLLRALQGEEIDVTTLESAIAPLDCPPVEHWQWWRMAKTGLGLPRKNELQIVDRPRPYGLTQQDIAEKIAGAKTEHGISERTVTRAIDRCWHYVGHQPVNVKQIADLAGLNEGEGLVLFFLIDVLSERRKAQRAKRREQPPDK